MNPRQGTNLDFSKQDWRERNFSLIWTLLLPLRLYLRYFPVQHGKGILLRSFLIPLLPPTDAEFELQMPVSGKISLKYRETLGLSSLLYGTFELAELEFAARYLRLGDQAMDVGANVGIFSVLIGKAVGESGNVLAFEPAPDNISRLKANLDRNGLGNVQVIACALGDSERQMNLHLATDPAYPSLLDVQSGLSDGTQVSVRVRRLDHAWEEAGMPQIAFIKMDVEGAEPDVVRGALHLLQSCHPTLLIEANTSEHLSILRQLLLPMGYKMAQPEGFAPHNYLFFHPASVPSDRQID